MNLAFNEISFRPYFKHHRQLEIAFIEMLNKFKQLKTEYGVQHLIFPTDQSGINVLADQNLPEWINGLKGINKALIFSIIKRPFSSDILEDHVDRLAEFYFVNSELGIEETYCTGLGLAKMQEIASISLNTDEFWCSESLRFMQIDPNTLEEQTVSVVNVASCDIVSELFKQLAENNSIIELIETEIEPDAKPIHFRDDHGTDILTKFAKRLVKSEYVISVINSLHFNSSTVKFIRRVLADGKIEIVLFWEDKGYGMVIQTTGRNYRETKKIAEILEEKYSK